MYKLVRIADSVPVKLFLDAPKKMGPIAPMWMTDTQIWIILADRKPPVHIYAVNPDNPSEQVILTKRNYQMTNEELFGTSRVINEDKNETVEVHVDETPVVEDTVVDTQETTVEETTSEASDVSDTVTTTDNFSANEENVDVEATVDMQETVVEDTVDETTSEAFVASTTESANKADDYRNKSNKKKHK